MSHLALEEREGSAGAGTGTGGTTSSSAVRRGAKGASTPLHPACVRALKNVNNCASMGVIVRDFLSDLAISKDGRGDLDAGVAATVTRELMRGVGASWHPESPQKVQHFVQSGFSFERIFNALLLPGGVTLEEFFEGVQEKRPVCGRVFEDGDLAYTCLDCRTDGTCVLCEECFTNGNHEGHRVRYHQTSAGGICDCGDHEAWKPSGFCKAHSGILEKSSGAEGPGEGGVLPGPIRDRAAMIIQQVIEYLKTFVLRERASFQELPAAVDGQDWLVVLHNDDKHTYEEVTGALKRCLPDAIQHRQMTERVDKYGSAIVYCGGHELVEKIAERLRSTFGLLVSIKRATWETEAGVCNMGIRWLHKLASSSPSFAAMITAAFAKSSGGSPKSGAIPALGHPSLHRLKFFKTIRGTPVFWCPAAIDTAKIYYYYDDDEWKWSPVELDEMLPLNGKSLVSLDTENLTEFQKVLLLGNEEIFRYLQRHPKDAKVYLHDVLAEQRSWERQDKKRIKLTIDNDGKVSKQEAVVGGHAGQGVTALEACICNDELLPKEVIKELHMMYATLWATDADFKTSFSLFYTQNLPSRCYKFSQGVGTDDESLEKLFCVQVFTTPSIVEKLCVENELLAGTLAAIHLSFVNSFRNNLVRSAHIIPKLKLDSWALKHDRHNLSYEHLYYTLRIPAGMKLFVWQTPANVGLFLWHLSCFQRMSTYTRKCGNHTEYESDEWQRALSCLIGMTTRFFHTMTTNLALEDAQTGGRARGAGKEADTLAYAAAHDVESRQKKTAATLKKVQSLMPERSLGPINRSQTNVLLPEHSIYKDIYDNLSPNTVLLGRTTASQCMIALSDWAIHTRVLKGVRMTDAPTGVFPVLQFDVLKDPVSLYYPLHNFFAMFIHYHEAILELSPRDRRKKSSLNQLFPVSPNHAIKSSRVYTERQAEALASKDLYDADDGGTTWLGRLVLLEFPLQVAAFASQVVKKLWTRNGPMVSYQVVSCMQPPYCHGVMNLAIKALQIGLVGVGAEHFLTCFVDRFGLEAWLYDEYNIRGIKNPYINVNKEGVWGVGAEEAMKVMGEMLRYIITVATEFHGPLESLSDNILMSGLRREVVHHLAIGPKKRSELVKRINSSTGISLLSHDSSKESLWGRLADVLPEIAKFKEGNDGEPGEYVLKNEIMEEYDPYFLHLSREAHNKVREKWLKYRAESYKSNRRGPRPPVFKLRAPPKHFEAVHDMLLSPALLEIIRPLLARKKVSPEVLANCVHLLGLSVIMLKESHGSQGGNRVRFLRSIAFRHPCGINDRLVVGTEIEEGSVIDSLFFHYRRVFEPSEVQEDANEALLERENLEWILFGLEEEDSGYTMAGTLKESIHSLREEMAKREKPGGSKSEEAGEKSENGSKAKSVQDAALKAMNEKQNAFLAMMEEESSEDDSDGSDGSDDSSDGSSAAGASGENAASEGKKDESPSALECMFCHEYSASMVSGYIGYGFLPAGSSKSLSVLRCSHAAHFDCLDTYLAMQHSRPSRGIMQNIDAENSSEFFCPLCKRLSNILIPSLPPPLVRESPGSLMAPAKKLLGVAAGSSNYADFLKTRAAESPKKSLTNSQSAALVLFMTTIVNVESLERESKVMSMPDMVIATLVSTIQTVSTSSFLQESSANDRSKGDAINSLSLKALLRACRASIETLGEADRDSLYKVFWGLVTTGCAPQGQSPLLEAFFTKVAKGKTLLDPLVDMDAILITGFVLFSNDIPVLKTIFKVVHCATISQATLYNGGKSNDSETLFQHMLSLIPSQQNRELVIANAEQNESFVRSTQSARSRCASLAYLLLNSLEDESLAWPNDRAMFGVEKALDLPSFKSIVQTDGTTTWSDWLETWCGQLSESNKTLNMIPPSVYSKPSFVELEDRYDRLLGRKKSDVAGEISEDSQPCLCLLCGKCLPGGKKNANNVGACHVHANTEGHCEANAALGVGVFICLRSTRVVIMRKKWAAYYPSIYVDEYGETDPYMRRGAPLVLNRRRLEKLQDLWASGRLANEVTSIRMKSNRIILNNWF